MRTTISRGCTVLGIAALAAFALAQPARAWWRGGVWIGVSPGVVVGPPLAYAPPYPYPYPYPYAYPPPAYGQPPADYSQAPPQGSQGGPPPADYSQSPPPPAYQNGAPSGSQRPVAYAGMCYAGVYTCAAAPYTQVGATCACSGIGAPSYGTAR